MYIFYLTFHIGITIEKATLYNERPMDQSSRKLFDLGQVMTSIISLGTYVEFN